MSFYHHQAREGGRLPNVSAFSYEPRNKLITDPTSESRVPAAGAWAWFARNLLLHSRTRQLKVGVFQTWSGLGAERPDRRHRCTPWAPNTHTGYCQRFWCGARLGVRPRSPPETAPRHPKAQGVFLEVQSYPRGAQQRPLFTTTGPGTLESGLRTTCGGRRRPGTCVQQRAEARGALQENQEAGSTGMSEGAPSLS